MKDSIVRFPSRHGHRLTGRLQIPRYGRIRAYALFAHCFTCSKDLKALGEIVAAFERAGIATLRFDFTGLGDSEGTFAETSLSHNADDLLDAAAFLEQRYTAPGLLVGHSFGGAAVLQAAPLLPTVRAVATIAAPFDPAHITHLLGRPDPSAAGANEGDVTVTIAGRTFALGHAFFDDLAGARLRRDLRGLGRPLLVLHSPSDTIVGIENARLLFDGAMHPKSFVSLDGADHLLTRRADARFAGETIAAWAGRYLGTGDAPGRLADLPVDRIVARTTEGLRTEASVRGFPLVLDEPIEVGGTASGPSPHDLLSSALAACTSMTLRMYADRKGWPLRSVRVEVQRGTGEVDRAGPEQPQTETVLFDRTIVMDGPLDDSQRRRLLQIADRCPVHRTLTARISVRTSLAGSVAGKGAGVGDDATRVPTGN